MIRIVVDANIILSALLGGSPRFILFDSQFEFITAKFTLEEVERYLPYIAEKSGVSAEELKEAISLLPLIIFSKERYSHMLPKARKALQDIDSHDADILALYYTEETYLWSEDKDFERVAPQMRLLKTKDFF